MSANLTRAIARHNQSRYGLIVAAKSAARFGDLNTSRRNSAHYPKAGAFFVSAFSSYGGCAWDTFGYAGCLESRFANLRTAATLNRLATIRGSSSTLGAATMKHALNPSTPSSHADAYKAMALAALRADSSLSVRLARYNSHMAKARTLEAQGVSHA
jgi:hypothetical protein